MLLNRKGTVLGPNWTKEECALITGGVWQGDLNGLREIEHFCYDSRELHCARPGLRSRSTLFLALHAARDGHAYVGDALAGGAKGAIVDSAPSGIATDAPLLCVKDTDRALSALALHARDRSMTMRLGITGSAGKTTLKMMLMKALAAFGVVYGDWGNRNNMLGLRASLAGMPALTRFGIFELGVNRPGEMLPLSDLLRPDLVVVSNIGRAHLGHFGSQRAIAQEKMQIWRTSKRENAPRCVILPADDSPCSRYLRDQARRDGVDYCLTFGQSESATAQLLGETMPGVHALRVFDQTIEVDTHFTGTESGIMLCACLLICSVLGHNVYEAAERLRRLLPPRGRGRRHVCELPQGGCFYLFDESYNASPESMLAGIHRISHLASHHGGRAVAVLGAMGELGAHSQALHAEILDAAGKAGLNGVVVIGDAYAQAYTSLPRKMRWGLSKNTADAVLQLKKKLRANDFVIIKGAHAMQLDDVVQTLRRLEQRGTVRA